MSRIVLVALVFLSTSAGAAAEQANFVHVTIQAGEAGFARVIWKPHQGVVGTTVSDQQADVQRMHAVPNMADSMRRWRDSTVRDTTTLALPTQLVVDMGGGPIIIRGLGQDSVEVTAVLTSGRGKQPVVWGRSLIVSGDGQTARIEREQ